MAQSRPTRTVGSVADFLAHTQALSPAEFGERYPHPFLVEQAATEAGVPGKTAATLAPGQPVRVGRPERLRVLKVRKVSANDKFRHVTVGRTTNNDIALPDGTVSKLHAYFVEPAAGSGAAWQLVDMSTYGTFLDGTRLEKEKPVQIPANATPGREPRITFGDRSFRWVQDSRMVLGILREG